MNWKLLYFAILVAISNRLLSNFILYINVYKTFLTIFKILENSVKLNKIIAV